MTKLPKLNVRLLNRIKKHLRAEPKRYWQGSWGKVMTPEEGGPVCNTQGCIAGWAVFLSVPKASWKRWMDRTSNSHVDLLNDLSEGIPRKAKALLGLTKAEGRRLFATENQSYGSGEEGVAEAERKIDDLIADRASFVEKW